MKHFWNKQRKICAFPPFAVHYGQNGGIPVLLSLPKDELKAFLLAGGDCEALGTDEYVADLYDAEKPLTVNLKETEKGFELLAAAEMLFDEEMDGWYMGERVEDAEMVERALRNAMNDGRA